MGAGLLLLLTAGALAVATLQVSAQEDATPPAPVEVGGVEQVSPPTEVIPSVDVPLDELTSEITEVGNPPAPVPAPAKAPGEIGKLASRLLDRTTSRGTGRPVKEGELVIPYEPDPRVLENREDSVLATLGDESISLMDAVRKTLEHAPEIQIAKEEVIASEGAVQSAAGQFDVHFAAGGSYLRGQEEMDIRRVAGEQRAFDRDKGFVSAANEAIEAITAEIQVIRDGGSPTSRFVRNPDGSVTVDGSFGADLSGGDVTSTVVTGEQDLQTQLDDALIDAAKDLATPAEAMNIAEIEKQFIEEGIANRKFVRKILQEECQQRLEANRALPTESDFTDRCHDLRSGTGEAVSQRCYPASVR